MKRGSLKRFWKKTAVLSLTAMCVLNFGSTQIVWAEGTESATEAETASEQYKLEAGTYQVPIKSLVSAAPLPAVQEAFATAFGTQAVLNVAEDGSMEAVVNCHNMQINLMGTIYYANVMTVQDATYHTYQTVTSSKAFGSSETEQIQAPDEVSFPLPIKEDGTSVLEITVDFMDKFLGGGEPYPTNVTLTLDFDNAKKKTDFTDLKDFVAECEKLSADSYTKESYDAFAAVLAEAKEMVAADDGFTVSETEKNEMMKRLTDAKNDLVEVTKDDDSKKDDDGKKDDDTKKDDDSKKDESEKLEDGTYSVSVALYHATKDTLSMASSAILPNAEIVVKDGVSTMYIHTQPMTFGSITASLQELKVADINNQFKDAAVTTKSKDGNPTGFSFVLPHQGSYLTLKVNPHVAMMGNMDLDARLFVDYTTLKKVSDDTTDDTNKNGSTTDGTDNNGSTTGSNTTTGNNGTAADNNTTTGSTENTTNNTVTATTDHTASSTTTVNVASDWDIVAAQLAALQEKGTVTAAVSDATVVSKTVLEQLKGQDKNLVIQLGNGARWTINGKNITADSFQDLDLGVILNANVIPQNLVNQVAGNGNGSMQIRLNHNGAFGFTGILTVNVGTQYAGQYANLYYYNASTGKMELVGSYAVNANGETDLTFTHASDYVLVMDNEAYTVKAPTTGDESNMVFAFFVLLAGAGVCAVSARKKYEK